MTEGPGAASQHWWRRRTPSVLVFLAVIAAMVMVSAALWGRVSDLLPGVGVDEQGEDPWTDPVGIEQVGDLYIARIPSCAAAPVVRIELWDSSSEPFWSVSGPPTPMASFALGFTPEGFTEDVGYKEPPADAVQRLVVVRSVKGVAGLRFEDADLVDGLVIAGNPIVGYDPEDWAAASVCGKGSGPETTTTTTSIDGG